MPVAVAKIAQVTMVATASAPARAPADRCRLLKSFSIEVGAARPGSP
jgi:hypothetical protein